MKKILYLLYVFMITSCSDSYVKLAKDQNEWIERINGILKSLENNEITLVEANNKIKIVIPEKNSFDARYDQLNSFVSLDDIRAKNVSTFQKFEVLKKDFIALLKKLESDGKIDVRLRENIYNISFLLFEKV